VENHLKAHDWFLRRPVRSVKHKQNPEEVAEKKSPRRMAGPELILLFGDSAADKF
jgi:hypothetical protein